jgi:hypothetical protein
MTRQRVAFIVVALAAPSVAALTCKSSVETSGSGSVSGAPTTAGPTASAGGAGGSSPEAGGGGVAYPPDADAPWDAWCAPDASIGNTPDMVSSCCNNEPCWGYCIPEGAGWVCDCYGIQGGCPLDSGRVCCITGACTDPDICPLSN